MWALPLNWTTSKIWEAWLEGGGMTRVKRIGHVVLNVRDTEASTRFYTEALGMEVAAFNDKIQMAFLTFGSQHHDIALLQAPDGVEPSVLGLNHIALEIEGGEEELRRLYGRLINMGTRIEDPIDHGISRSVYFFDPDGNRLEIYYDALEGQEARDYLRDAHGGPYRSMELEPIA